MVDVLLIRYTRLTMTTLLYDITLGSPESYKYKDLDPMAHKQMSCDKINPKIFY